MTQAVTAKNANKIVRLMTLSVIALLTSLLLALQLTAAPQKEFNVSYADGTYRLKLKIHSPLTPNQVYQLLTDYDNLNQINPSIRKSRVLPVYNGDNKQVLTLAQGCMLGFCKSVQKVEKVVEQNRMSIAMEVIPGRSDFRHGKSRWIIMPSGKGTEIEYYSAMQPSFYIPPMIGPLLIKHWLKQQLKITAERLTQPPATQ